MAAVSVAALGFLAVLTAAEEPSLSPTYLLQFGVLGLVLAAIVWRRWLVPGWSLDEKDREVERLRAELAALRAAYEEKADRTMAALTDAVEELTRSAGPRRPSR